MKCFFCAKSVLVHHGFFTGLYSFSSGTIALTNGDGWYRKIKEVVDQQQIQQIWMADTPKVRFIVI